MNFPKATQTTQTTQATQTVAEKRELIHLENVNKNYHLGEISVQALKDINLTISSCEFVAVAGPSGSGKSTLLNIIGCIDTASDGEVRIDRESVLSLHDHALTNIRLHKIGFIFQSFNLIPVLNIYDNIEFPLLLKGNLSKAEMKEKIYHFAREVGLIDQLFKKPHELSGGQRQRVAIARALVTNPYIVLADEPTANLDSITGRSIINLMKTINETEKTAFLFSTHDQTIIAEAKRVVRLHDGKIISDE
ncbi:MAG: ABC transporter ATP-binding protein [Oligoflexia bacterium]|nr:ABC transporter ATP-binding protein [Oligoflexia bacterium]